MSDNSPYEINGIGIISSLRVLPAWPEPSALHDTIAFVEAGIQTWPGIDTGIRLQLTAPTNIKPAASARPH